MREAVIKMIEEEKLIVIVRNIEREKLIPLGEAMYDGGIRLMEITYSADKRISDEEIAKSIKVLSEHFDGRMFIGAGTVLSKEQVTLTAEAGGKFIISPDTNAEVIKETRKMGLVSMPGAMTPSESLLAHRAGADFVKLFPANNLGADYIKAIVAPLSDIRFIAVGGIDENNIGEYMSAGASGFGIGSSIVKREQIMNDKWNEITLAARRYKEAVKRGQEK